jgi:hypothetical protein
VFDNGGVALTRPLEAAPRREGLREIAGRARPVVLAGDQLVPVLPPLAPLLPDGGLRRGSTVAVSRSTSLALALAAGASAAGSWCAAVGAPTLGLVAASEMGIALERFPLVAAPGDRAAWATVVAALLDAMDVVLAWPPPHVRQGEARRLAARARERGAVLVVCATGFADTVDLRLAPAQVEWHGLERGAGRLRARRVEVVAGGRRAAARERRAWLWLPGADGGVAAADPPVLGTRTLAMAALVSREAHG